MPYRLVGRAEDRIDAVLLESAQKWGIPAAARYHRLILAAAAAIGEAPGLPGSRDVPRVAGTRALHLRHVRGLAAQDRVAEPRHLIVYRVAGDGVVEILSIVHDRMLACCLDGQPRKPFGRPDPERPAAGLCTPLEPNVADPNTAYAAVVRDGVD